MHVSLYQRCDSSLLGHADLSKPTPVWNTLSICPTTLTNSETTGEKLLSVVGNDNGLSFTVQIAEGASEIALDQPHTVNVQGDEVSVFQFISPQGISDKQLDITATSQSNVAAYLKVSQNCKEVDVQKDLKSNKKESLRLSFATKGRITLSSVSIPPLTDSVSKWFIVIGLKNLSGDVKRSESKSVTLKLTRSFDYSYTTPIFVLLFVSFVVGILVSIVAYYLFEKSLTQVKPGRGVCNLNLRITYRDLLEVIIDHWFSFGPKTYSYITGIVGNVLMVGAFQFVFANWYTMIQEGDRDNCYYNDFCYRVASHDIPFNLMISNLTYIVHGLILVVWVLILETKVNLRCKSRAANVQGSRLPEHILSCPETNIHHLEGGIPKPENPMETEERKKEENIFFAKAMKKRYCFSIGYAFSWGLVFEGLFSTLYHFCPSRFTFQFDSAFMFIIAGLTVLLLYNGIEQNRCPSSGNAKHPVGASNFFLFFIVPLFTFNYFGVLFNSDSGLNKVMQGFFFAFLIIWWLVMDFWAFRKLDIHKKIRGDDCKDKCDAFLFLLGGLIVPCGIFMLYLFSDLAQVFLFACIACSVVAILAKARPWKKLCKCECKCVCDCDYSVKAILQGLFIFLTIFILLAAFAVFKALPTTNKTSSPENSRDQNEECVIFGFFDWHDLWHFLSSFALLMGAFAVMFISFEPEQSPQAEALRKKKGITGSNVREIRARRKREKIAETHMRRYTLLYFRDLASRVLLYCRTLTLRTFCGLSLIIWPLPLVMMTLLVGATHDKVEGQFEIQMEA